MKKAIKWTLVSILALLIAAIITFVCIYFTRLQTISTIEKITNYNDTDLTAQVVIRRDWNTITVYDLKNNAIKK